jgi:zinc transporter 1
MLVIDIAFFLLELGVGLVVGSLALMADAFHMVWIDLGDPRSWQC